MNAKNRLSNIELLRILSMFCVLIVHANFGALGFPTYENLVSDTTYTLVRIIIESFSIMAVNVFVLISGWFGISFSLKGILNLLFQCCFFLFGIFSFCYLFNLTDISLKSGIYRCLMLSENVWFVKSYLGMYIFAPIINSFIENSNKKQVEVAIVSFYIFQSIYGWLSNGAAYIADGYSAFSFMGLYLLARYVRIYSPKWSNATVKMNFILYVLFSSLTALGFIVFLYCKNQLMFYILFKYTSIFTISAAMFLLLAFKGISIRSTFINKVAASCFSVYLFHFILFSNYVSPVIYKIHVDYSGICMLALIVGVLILFYALAILVDQLRLIFWNILLVRFIKDRL